jgi:hypothetical protein
VQRALLRQLPLQVALAAAQHPEPREVQRPAHQRRGRLPQLALQLLQLELRPLLGRLQVTATLPHQLQVGPGLPCLSAAGLQPGLQHLRSSGAAQADQARAAARRERWPGPSRSSSSSSSKGQPRCRLAARLDVLQQALLLPATGLQLLPGCVQLLLRGLQLLPAAVQLLLQRRHLLGGAAGCLVHGLLCARRGPVCMLQQVGHAAAQLAPLLLRRELHALQLCLG